MFAFASLHTHSRHLVHGKGE